MASGPSSPLQLGAAPAAALLAAFAAHSIGGAALAHLSAPALRTMGVQEGLIGPILAHIARHTVNIVQHVPPGLDPCSRYHWLHGGKQRIFVDLYMMRLLGVDEAQYQFAMTYWFIELWHDDRHIFLPEMDATELAACPTDARVPAADGSLSFKCAEQLWGQFPDPLTGRGTVSQNKADSEVLSGDPVMHFGDTPGFENMVSATSLTKATFNTEMSFDSFPFDRQNLTFAFTFPPTTEIVLGSTGMAPVTPGFEAAPGWAIEDFSAALGIKSFFLEGLPAMHPFAFGTEGASAKNDFPGVFFTLRVTRASAFYIWNLVFPVVLLSLLSWSSFIMQPTSIDVRLATTMTILIALVAFNFIVNDSLPKTGSLTKMHSFLLVSNVFIVLSGLESLLVFYLVEQDLSTVSQMKAHLCRTCGCNRCGRRRRPAAVAAVRSGASGETKSGGGSGGDDGVVLATQAAAGRWVGGDDGPLERAASKASLAAPVLESAVMQGDGIVTKEEIANIHRIDRVCAFAFPLLYSVLTAAILAHD